MRRALALIALLALPLGGGATRLAARAEAAEPPHFHSGAREVVVENRTGDGAWSAALTHAAAAWNRAGVVRITHVGGAGDCERVVRGRLLFCSRSAASMGGAQGWAYPFADHGHLVGGRAWGCADCAGDARKRAIAAHELGHLLGLGHSDDPTSAMCPTGCAESPSPADLERLRAIHAHTDDAALPVDHRPATDLLGGHLPAADCGPVCL